MPRDTRVDLELAFVRQLQCLESVHGKPAECGAFVYPLTFAFLGGFVEPTIVWAGRKVTAFKRLTLSTYGTRCHFCGEDIDTGLHHNDKMSATVHHLIPKVRLDPARWFDLELVRPAHRSCNSSAGDRVAEGSCPVHGSVCAMSRHSRDW